MLPFAAKYPPSNLKTQEKKKFFQDREYFKYYFKEMPKRKRSMRGQQFNFHEILKCKGLENEMLLTKQVLGPRAKRSLRTKTLEVISMLPCIPK